MLFESRSLSAEALLYSIIGSGKQWWDVPCGSPVASVLRISSGETTQAHPHVATTLFLGCFHTGFFSVHGHQEAPTVKGSIQMTLCTMWAWLMWYLLFPFSSGWNRNLRVKGKEWCGSRWSALSSGCSYIATAGEGVWNSAFKMAYHFAHLFSPLWAFVWVSFSKLHCNAV